MFHQLHLDRDLPVGGVYCQQLGSAGRALTQVAPPHPTPPHHTQEYTCVELFRVLLGVLLMELVFSADSPGWWQSSRSRGEWTSHTALNTASTLSLFSSSGFLCSTWHSEVTPRHASVQSSCSYNINQHQMLTPPPSGRRRRESRIDCFNRSPTD